MRPYLYFEISLLFILCLVLNTCGFKLKQEQTLVSLFSSVAVVHKRADPGFINLLENTLEQRGVRISPLAAIDLNILSYAEQRQAASVNTTNARQTETRITKELKFSLSSKQGKLLIAPTTLRASREYLNDNRNIGGKAEEERMLQKTLDKEMVKLLMRHLENEALRNGFLEAESSSTANETNTTTTNSDIDNKAESRKR